ncbi:MAG: hypothetical protein NBV68_03245 [Erythrobacter sp.]|uniref:hypothetical protein n=1 Tax=Erythrobacter sp. TaxID=1042 RepID=UPI0025FADEB0|nr:hypothetical protein [Erythrobacter sp.]MCL9998373.1 hypothetical protein [Erythrobacter sp.]
MTDLRTISPDELPTLSEVPEDLHSVVFSPGGPLQAVPFEKLLTKLIAANLTKANKAALDADLAHAADSVALVFSDPTPALNGWYRKLDASGAGSWEQFEELARSARLLAQQAVVAAQAWVEGPEPGGAGTKSAKGWAETAQAIADDIASDRAMINSTLSEFVAGTWTSTTTGFYRRQDNGLEVAQPAWAYHSYTISADDVRDEAGKPIIELTFQLNTPIPAVAAAVYLNGSGVVIGQEYIGANVNIDRQTQRLDAPAATATVLANFQIAVFSPTFRVRRVVDRIAERLAGQEAQNVFVPEMQSALSAYAPVSPSYVNGRIVNRTTGAITDNADFRYFVVNVDAAAGEMVKVTAGTFNSGATFAGLVCFSGADLAGAVTGSFVTGNTTPQDVATVIGNGGVPNLPANTKSVAFVNRILETPYRVEKFAVQSDLAAKVVALEADAGSRRSKCVWGESNGTITNGFFDEFQALHPTDDVYMQALGGQPFIGFVEVRMGLKKTTIDIAGGQIPISGTATCTLANDMLRPPASMTNSTQVMVQGVRCNLTRTGDQSSFSYTISAMDPIASARSVPPGSEVTVLTGFVAGSSAAAAPPLATLLGGDNVFVCFYNDRSSNDYPGLANALSAAVEYVSRFGGTQLWLSPPPVQAMLPTTDSNPGFASSEAASYGFLDHTRMLRRLMASIAPRHFDTTQWLIDAGATTAKTISAVTFQVATTTAATSYLNPVDLTHMNAPGQSAWAAAIKASLDGAG